MHIAQFIKLEIVILHLLKQQDLSSDQIYDILKKHFTVIEGELLTSLYFLSQTQMISIHSHDHHLIYHIEEAGCTRYTTLKREYHHIHQEMEVLFQNEKTEIYKSCHPKILSSTL